MKKTLIEEKQRILQIMWKLNESKDNTQKIHRYLDDRYVIKQEKDGFHMETKNGKIINPLYATGDIENKFHGIDTTDAFQIINLWAQEKQKRLNPAGKIESPQYTDEPKEPEVADEPEVANDSIENIFKIYDAYDRGDVEYGNDADAARDVIKILIKFHPEISGQIKEIYKEHNRGQLDNILMSVMEIVEKLYPNESAAHSKAWYDNN